MPPTYKFVFETEAAALRYTERLTRALNHLAIMRDGPRVTVFDGGDDDDERDRRTEITRLARESSGVLLAAPSLLKL